MHLHIGGDILVNEKDIIGIFDMENTTVSRLGRHFLTRAQKDGCVISAAEDMPKSYVVAKRKDKSKIYISSVSTQVLAKRARSADTI